MAQRSHVPKFGNWDGDNVPYTVFFENARKEKAAGIRINPNDPEQNPNAFDQYKSPSDSANSVPNNRNSHQRKMSHSHAPPSPFRRPTKPISHHASDDFSTKSASVPKFGVWDEMDPKSADGYTVIFNKVKEEKQIASAKFPTVPSSTNNDTARSKENKNSTPRSKRCCCLF